LPGGKKAGAPEGQPKPWSEVWKAMGCLKRLVAVLAVAVLAGAIALVATHHGAAGLYLALAGLGIGVTINELPRLTDLIMFQEGEEANYTVDLVTVASGTVASVQGQILGKVTASGKYAQVAPAASDGSQVAAAVLIQPFGSTLAADGQYLAITRGPVIFKAGGLAYTSGMTAGQKTAAQQQLAAAGMPVRTDYGV
jgi:hypothetical protein